MEVIITESEQIQMRKRAWWEFCRPGKSRQESEPAAAVAVDAIRPDPKMKINSETGLRSVDMIVQTQRREAEEQRDTQK
jgi:hypothetical protein